MWSSGSQHDILDGIAWSLVPFMEQRYWGRPVPGWGDEEPSVLIVGLAPAAHGGNRNGRVFTGDRSGDFIFGSLYRCGLAARPYSVAAAMTTAAGRCLSSAATTQASRTHSPAASPRA